MYIVLNAAGSEVFKGCLSDATDYIVKHFGPLDQAIRRGVRLVPHGFPCFKAAPS